MHHHAVHWIIFTSSFVDLMLMIVLLRPTIVMTSSTVALLRHGDDMPVVMVTSDGCYQSRTEEGAMTVRCSWMGLTQVPAGIPNLTFHLLLDNNQLSSLPSNSLFGLRVLHKLDLSHNQLTLLEPGCFRDSTPTLRFLDLSSNRLSTLDPAALGGLRAHANLTSNPWHCDCKLQVSMPKLDLDPSSLADVICHSSDVPEMGGVGVPFVLLAEELDLCLSMRRTTDVAMLVTMFLWFSMVISYLVHYVRHNQEDARRHLEYLKSLPMPQVQL
ncbi:leucine-rich repeat-containing protein 3-like [Gadus macrocephalus]|uniref:leucine-rich repeat-containing protein 3-like n=2 Tax=Gadus TaxID=8048 RepID=UPI0028CB4397|nr:leucine-rich repeat-containing protein 3-like [Gadus macrocephalus]